MLSIGGELGSPEAVQQPSALPHKRKIGCLRIQNFGFRHLACSLHAATQRHPDANRDQLLHALNVVPGWDDGGYLPIVGGIAISPTRGGW